MKIKVLVCDDLPDDNGEFKDEIEKAGPPKIEIKRIFGNGLKDQLNELIAGADRAFQSGDGAFELPKTEFDDFDLVILDNNLAHLRIDGARLTAEAVAGYIRAFSSAAYIVSVNKNPDVDFDLRYLIGDYTTRTDLALNTRHLSNLALWTHSLMDAKAGFLPWYWPKLLDTIADRRQKIAFVKKRLDQPIIDELGIAVDDFNFLSRQARSLLSQAEETRDDKADHREPYGATATFGGVFLASGRSLPDKKERELLNRKRTQGVDGVESIIAKVVAAEIDLWFRRDVLGPQEALVDVPHLLMRMPFLLGDRVSQIEHWNVAVDAATNNPPFGLDQALFDAHLKQALFDEGAWSTLPCFWWPKLSNDDALTAHFSRDRHSDWANVVFCEDRSEFLPMDPENGGSSPTEFVAQFEGSWNRRYVAEIDGIKYVPKTRFTR